MGVTETASTRVCSRCGGALMAGAPPDELACFACGAIVYLHPLADPREVEPADGRQRRRQPRYGRLRL